MWCVRPARRAFLRRHLSVSSSLHTTSSGLSGSPLAIIVSQQLHLLASLTCARQRKRSLKSVLHAGQTPSYIKYRMGLRTPCLVRWCCNNALGEANVRPASQRYTDVDVVVTTASTQEQVWYTLAVITFHLFGYALIKSTQTTGSDAGQGSYGSVWLRRKLKSSTINRVHDSMCVPLFACRGVSNDFGWRKINLAKYAKRFFCNMQSTEDTLYLRRTSSWDFAVPS